MKKAITAMAVAIATLAAVAPARAASYTGDLLAGFTTRSGTDVIFDLGQRSSLTDGQTWDISSAFSTAGMSLSGTPVISWGVIGTKNVGGITRTVWSTSPIIADSVPGAPQWAQINNNMLRLATAGNTITLAPNDTILPLATDANSWNVQTVFTGLGLNIFANSYQDPNSPGFITVPFWEVVADNSVANQIGTFNFANNGIVTFSAVPEPSTYGFLVLAALLYFAIHRKHSSIA